MGSVEFLEDLIHDGVGEIRHDGQLHLPGGVRERKRERERERERPIDLIALIEWSMPNVANHWLSPVGFRMGKRVLTLGPGGCPALLSPSARCGWPSEGWTRGQRQTTVVA